ncbi:MAG TPA: XdhC family protein [Anaerolineae bacterium]|nr:XdhC family protein [Anaerolineae bacterium]
MQEIISEIDQWLVDCRTPIALATVIQTWGSAPRRAGAKMAVNAAGEMAGSVSGGCVEGAVVEAAQQTLADGRPQLLHFGVADETAWEVGLACGGTIDIFVEPLDNAAYAFQRQLIAQNKAGAVITIIRGPEKWVGKKLLAGTDGRLQNSLSPELDALAAPQAQNLAAPQAVQLTNEIETFVDAVRPSPTLIMVGGVHIAIPLAAYAKTLGYKTIVVDPRRAFASDARFPHVDKLIAAWPQKAFTEIELTGDTAVALLTHDPKIDDPALDAVLNSPVFYIGALGSRKTHAKRCQRLQAKGFNDQQITRIHGPIGLNIHAVTPAEIALAIVAEITQVRRS